MSYDFRDKVIKCWSNEIKEIFPNKVPEIYEWNDRNEIVNVLSRIAKRNLNHMYFPDGGGDDIDHVSLASESDCILLGSFLIKPKKLIFNSFGEADQWACFRIEADTLEPRVRRSLKGKLNSEHVLLIDNEKYVDYDCIHTGYYIEDYLEKPLPENYFELERFFGGNFIIFAKACVYDDIDSSYSGFLNKMNNDEFRKYIESIKNKLKSK